MSNCCSYNSQADVLTELKRDAELKKNKNIVSTDNFDYSQLTECIILKQKEDPLGEYSLQLFQQLNLLRIEPSKFYQEKLNINLKDVIDELIKIDKKDKKLKWSTRNERIINDIMKDEKTHNINEKLELIRNTFSLDFEIKIFYSKSKSGNISLNDIFENIQALKEESFKDAMTNKIDYFIIYSIYEEQIKDNEQCKKDINQNSSNLSIVSFFFIFNYLNDNKYRSSELW